MCFGNKTNPEVRNGTDNLDQSHTRSSDYADQHLPNKPVKSSGSGWLANTPAGRSKAIVKNMSESERKGVRST
jgi:hypothetical protein